MPLKIHSLKPQRFIRTALSSAVLATILIQPASAYSLDEHDTIIEKALKMGQDDAKYGQFKVDLRYRFEMAETKNNTQDTGYANTLRLRLGYLTPEFHSFQGYAEFEGNASMQQDYFAPKGRGWTGDSGREVIADPQAAELNQLWISYKGIPDTELKAGRQRINLNDQRFIGAVGWRQMEQTFDAGVITNNSIENLTLQAGYIGRAQNIWSQKDEMQLPFANINYKVPGYANINIYGLWLADFDDGQAGKSAQTYGISVSGSPKITDNINALYHAEYSYQGDYKNSPVDFDISRYSLMAGAEVYGVTLKAGVEELGTSNGRAFQTPLGTNHKFQGWADKFLVTPVNGVRDVNATVGYKIFSTKLAFVYHNFQSVTNSIDYGNEYDFVVSQKFGKHLKLLASYAYYDADESNGLIAFNKDKHQFWLQAGVSY
ncbi:MAG: hypothetical protein GQ582_07120 [Methyloprofundus sp.]|nr:hypothetical protein [Methyloprofundus sp.]